MSRFIYGLAVVLVACAPAANPPPNYAAHPAARSASAGLAVRGRVPRGKRIDYIVAVSVDQRTGKRQRIRVRPTQDGSYTVQLPKGHRYALAYEAQGQFAGAVTFPNAKGGRPSQTINVSQNVIVNQNNQSQYIDLGDTNYVDGQYVAAYDPYAYLDSDGDGTPDEQDDDGAVDVSVAVDQQSFSGDFDDVDESAEEGQPVED